MTRLAPLLALAACAACARSADRWRYESILWEGRPEVGSAAAAEARFDRLAAAQELTLDDCYSMALRRSETIALDVEELLRLQAQYERALAAVQPAIAFRSSYARRDSAPSTAGLSTFRLEEQTEHRFTFRQPIFSGLREFHALSAASALRSARERSLRHARLRLFGDVAEAFYRFLRVERELQTEGDALRAARERLQELAARNRVGISRRSEVLAQEAQVASTEARIQSLGGARAVALEALRFLTGHPSPSRLLDTLEFAPPPPPQELVRLALERREDLRALQDEVRSAEASAGVARAGHWPTVALEANYYTHREGTSEGIDWDATVTMEVPIYGGGAVQAGVREADSNVRAAALRFERLSREVRVNLGRAHADVAAFADELASREKALASARENHEIVQAEYRGGIAANIEVLTAFTALRQAELDRDAARYSLKLSHARLAVESGELPEGIR